MSTLLRVVALDVVTASCASATQEQEITELRKAQALEAEGKGREAMQVGNARAALRLGEIYEKGVAKSR